MDDRLIRIPLDAAAADCAMGAAEGIPKVVELPPQEWRSAPSVLRWYVASTRPRFEAKVRDRTEAMGFGTFLPLALQRFTKRRYRWGRWYEEQRTRQVIAFPTYLFVCFDVADDQWRRIVQDRDIRMIFGSSPEQPRPVPEAHMAELFKEAQDRAMSATQIQALVEKGIVYRVVSGPMEGSHGECLDVGSDGRSLTLGLTFFGRTTPVKMTADEVERIR